MKVEIFVDALHDRGFQNGDLVNFVQKIVVDGGQEGRGRLTRSGTMAEGLPQLANMLTI